MLLFLRASSHSAKKADRQEASSALIGLAPAIK